MKRILRLLLGLLPVWALLASCSTSKNTATTRWYHSFTARYNTFYNARVAYTDGCLAKEQGIEDDFTEMLPVFAVGNKKAQDLGSAQFNTAIEKCEKAIKNHSIKRKPEVNRNRRLTPRQRVFLSLKEYNPFLRNAWLLMGQSQFQQGRFVEAAATFAYAARLYSNQPEVLCEVRAWLARCYTELEWFYDADDVIRRIGRDSITRAASRALDATLADYYVRQKKYDEALPYLKRTVRREHRKKLKARGYFLMAQIYNLQGDARAAYKALSHVIRQSPPYRVAFNARIMQTEVMPAGKSRQMIARLKRMARSSNNAEYLDQVYYAIGNIELARADTAAAIKAYEEGVKRGTRQGIERGVLLLTLGDLYWARLDFTSARRCYTSAVGLMDKERAEYERLSKRSKVLDELEPYTAAVHLQDSLQTLVRMPESQRNEAIDKQIEELKRREKEARRNAADSMAQAQAGLGQQSVPAGGPQNATTAGKDGGTWYFYNTQAVAAGKENFRRQWGTRKLEDNWRRSNKSVLETVAGSDDEATPTDSLTTDSTAVAADSLDTTSKSRKGDELAPEDDPHRREYYLKQLPFSEEQRAASDSIIMSSLHQAGVIEKDQLEDFPLARTTLLRVVNQYPAYSKMDDVLYQLFLIEGRMGHADEAETYRQRLAADYAESAYTRLITNPNYEFNARYGKQTEDSIYASAYESYRRGDTRAMMAACSQSDERFPSGANRPRFLFLNAMGQLNLGHREAFIDTLRSLVRQYPQEKISELAGLIVKGVESGRPLLGGAVDFSSMWATRLAGAAAQTDSIAGAKGFKGDRNVPFLIVMAYPLDSVNENRLLYEVARYNFMHFTVRSFELSQEQAAGIGQLFVRGFANFDEAVSYARGMHRDESFKSFFPTVRTLIISEANFKQIGVNYSIADYQAFYTQHFKPVFVQQELQLDRKVDVTEGESILPETDKQIEERRKAEQQKQQEQEQQEQDENEYYDVGTDSQQTQKTEDVIEQQDTDNTQQDDEEEWYDY